MTVHRAKRERLEADVMRRFFLAGGTASEWEKEKGELVRDEIRRRTIAADDEARRSFARS